MHLGAKWRNGSYGDYSIEPTSSTSTSSSRKGIDRTTKRVSKTGTMTGLLRTLGRSGQRKFIRMISTKSHRTKHAWFMRRRGARITELWSACTRRPDGRLNAITTSQGRGLKGVSIAKMECVPTKNENIARSVRCASWRSRNRNTIMRRMIAFAMIADKSNKARRATSSPFLLSKLIIYAKPD